MMTTHQNTKNSDDAIITALLTVILLLPMLLLDGFVISIIWNWFMPLVFIDIPRLTVGTGIGLMLVVATFRTIRRSEDDEDSLEKFTLNLLTTVVTRLLLLGISWVVYVVIA